MHFNAFNSGATVCNGIMPGYSQTLRGKINREGVLQISAKRAVRLVLRFVCKCLSTHRFYTRLLRVFVVFEMTCYIIFYLLFMELNVTDSDSNLYIK